MNDLVANFRLEKALLDDWRLIGGKTETELMQFPTEKKILAKLELNSRRQKQIASQYSTSLQLG